MEKKSLNIIIPVFNEEGSILTLFNRLELIRHSLYDLKIQFYFINDGSTDNTFNILQELALKNDHLKVISFTRNFGHQNALSCGIDCSVSDYVVTIDADLQDPPELIGEMYNLLKNNSVEVVYAQRKKREGESLFKLISAKLFYKFLNYLCDLQIPPDTGDYRLITKRVVIEFKKYKEKHKFIRGLIPWLGFKSMPIFYDRDKRYAGKTKYSFSRMINFAFNAIFSFSTKPIEYFSKVGLFFVIFSFFYGIFILYKKFILDEIIPGFTPIFLSIVFFGGFNLLFLGIIGHYVAKIFEQTKDRPNYIIDKKLNIEN
jgi:glycosyltransferase involved in cell wall biosynthesis